MNRAGLPAGLVGRIRTGAAGGFTPLDLTPLAVVVEGTGAVCGRQEWARRDHLDE